MENVSMQDITAFLSTGSGDGYGSGSGSGSGYGYGYGSGYGYGYGDGYGYGSGYGDGYGYGSGYGSGSGYGDGYGYGDGSGSGYGDGYGYGYGDGISVFCNEIVCEIDGIPTIIHKLAYGAAYGYILQSDLTLKKCWVAKSGNKFAHGNTLRAAREALAEKLFDDMPEDERIAAFWGCHNRDDKYSGRDLWIWHHRLTGSCEMGRNQFAADRGIDIDNSSFTVAEFVDLCKNAYGGNTVRKLIDDNEI